VVVFHALRRAAKKAPRRAWWGRVWLGSPRVAQ